MLIVVLLTSGAAFIIFKADGGPPAKRVKSSKKSKETSNTNDKNTTNTDATLLSVVKLRF